MAAVNDGLWDGCFALMKVLMSDSDMRLFPVQ